MNKDPLTKYEIEDEYYFLFGEGPCCQFNEEGIEGAIQAIREGDSYSLYKWNKNENTPMELLAAVENYYDWFQLTKEEYEQLQKPILEL